MTRKPGEALDLLIKNPRRLGVAHGCLGLLAAFSYWIRPGTFTPHLVVYAHRDVSSIYKTIVAWAPYIFAFFISRNWLANCSPTAVLAYIGLAIITTIIASGLYLGFFAAQIVPPLFIAGGVVLALALEAGICAVIGRSDVN
jgi:hypothetical protein